MPRDAPRSDAETRSDAAAAEAERIYRCARCGAEVTRGRWEIAVGGDHQRTVFNPAGIVFRILCFGEAPGAGAVGAPTADFSWFAGYAWSVALCRSCGAHLGWRFVGEGPPPLFFALIRAALTVSWR
ncbi:cereblon family protein [Azospirillum sp. ST 5-10]|uniref:cereblon family protein n=1 Tax=unclassified Azospirillum TaxID=2630922 RepID=UPI003F4A853B